MIIHYDSLSKEELLFLKKKLWKIKKSYIKNIFEQDNEDWPKSSDELYQEVDEFIRCWLKMWCRDNNKDFIIKFNV